MNLKILQKKINGHATDKSEFTHIDNTQIWVINIIDIYTKNFLLKVTKTREATNLKKFITNLFLLVIILLKMDGLVIAG